MPTFQPDWPDFVEEPEDIALLLGLCLVVDCLIEVDNAVGCFCSWL